MLSEREKQEIIRRIERDEPLPDKYRWRLFSGNRRQVEQCRVFHGKKYDRMVVVGPIDLPVNRLDIEAAIAECRKYGGTKVDVLGFEFEMGLFPHALEAAKSQGVALTPKYIPRDVFDRRAVEKH